MSKYRFHYKWHILEDSGYCHADEEAGTVQQALVKFFEGRIEDVDTVESYRGVLPDTLEGLDLQEVESWWEGNWLMVLRGTEEVDFVRCPVCDGRGELPSAVAASARKPLSS